MYDVIAVRAVVSVLLFIVAYRIQKGRRAQTSIATPQLVDQLKGSLCPRVIVGRPERDLQTCSGPLVELAGLYKAIEDLAVDSGKSRRAASRSPIPVHCG